MDIASQGTSFLTGQAIGGARHSFQSLAAAASYLSTIVLPIGISEMPASLRC